MARVVPRDDSGGAKEDQPALPAPLPHSLPPISDYHRVLLKTLQEQQAQIEGLLQRHEQNILGEMRSLLRTEFSQNMQPGGSAGSASGGLTPSNVNPDGQPEPSARGWSSMSAMSRGTLHPEAPGKLRGTQMTGCASEVGTIPVVPEMPQGYQNSNPQKPKYAENSSGNSRGIQRTSGLSEAGELASRDSKESVRTFSSFHGDDDKVVVPTKGLLRRAVSRLCRDKRFDFAIGGMILVNAGTAAVQADWGMAHIGQAEPLAFQVLEGIFATAFSLELLLHALDEGKTFLSCRSNANFAWNLFDLFVVLAAWVETVIQLFTESSGANISALRTVRVVRLVRIMRVIRLLRFFTDLRHMVEGILASLKPLVWCIMLLLLVMVCFSMVIVQVATIRISDHPDVNHEALIRWFNGMVRAVFTLHLAITGGVSWHEAADPLLAIHPVMGLLFSFYIAFAVLCVLNIVTGVFVENANSITKHDIETVIMEELRLHENRIEEMRRIFSAAGGSSDNLSVHQFVKVSQNFRVQAYFRRIGMHVDKESARALFALIDMNGDGSLGVDEFVDGCTQFIGGARQLDIARLRRDNVEMMSVMKDLMVHTLEKNGACTSGMEEIDARMHAVMQKTASNGAAARLRTMGSDVLQSGATAKSLR